MWRQRGRVNGIQNITTHHLSGWLFHSIAGCARQIHLNVMNSLRSSYIVSMCVRVRDITDVIERNEHDYRPSVWIRTALIAAGTSAPFPRMPCSVCPTAGSRKRPDRNTSDVFFNGERCLRCIPLCFMSPRGQEFPQRRCPRRWFGGDR